VKVQDEDQYEQASSLPPPYYETDAYPRVKARRLRKVFSVPVGLALGLTVTISWLCFLVERQYNPHRLGRHASGPPAAASAQLRRFQESLDQCAAMRTFPKTVSPSERKENERWNPTSGQKSTLVLRNVTLFDGEDGLWDTRHDIVFSKGLILSVSETGKGGAHPLAAEAEAVDLMGAFVTPGK